MSNVNIRRVVENIRSNTTIYTPLIEVIVNGIQAIESNGGTSGRIVIRAIRDKQIEIDGSLPDVTGFEVEDNGVGFTEENRKSFDTLYTDFKINDGGKGFGRFTCLKYFENLYVSSVFKSGNQFATRTFTMGKGNELIVNEEVTESSKTESGTIVILREVKKQKTIDKKLSTISRNLVEKLLPYFITEDYKCPEIILSESDNSGSIRLNDFFSNVISSSIKEIPVTNSTFELESFLGIENFTVRIFKIYSPKNQKSRISLVAHKRDVSGSPLYKYVPEFIDEFFDADIHDSLRTEKNYILKAYVFSPYLDRNVSLERGGFEFQLENDAIFGISQVDIEREAAEIAKEAKGSDIKARQEKKKIRVQSYVDDEAPWHKAMLDEIDLTGMPHNPTNEDIEDRLQKAKFSYETQIKREVSHLLADANLDNLKSNVLGIVEKISGTSKNDLIHYIALRRNILDIFSKSLQVDTTGIYRSEGVVHDIIFPRKGDSETTPFEEHNLWIIDERLNFTNYVSSDIPLNGGKSERPDLLAYNKRILFRGENEPSNPVTIFEFKKPQRDDFVNPSSTEDPVQQIIRYVNSIRDGKFLTPEGRRMLVSEHTPFYGYVVCDLTPKVETWLQREKNFKPMPDRLGWFQWFENINLYVEVISWDKILKDATARNKVFFHKLGII